MEYPIRLSGWLSEAGKFAIVGAGITVLNYGVFFVLYQLLNVYYLPAAVIGYVTGLVVGFVFNRTWTFRSGDGRPGRQMVAYFLVNIVSLMVSTLFLKFLVTVLSFNPLIANVGAIGFSATINFLGYKFFVFRAPASNKS